MLKTQLVLRSTYQAELPAGLMKNLHPQQRLGLNQLSIQTNHQFLLQGLNQLLIQTVHQFLLQGQQQYPLLNMCKHQDQVHYLLRDL